MKQRIYSIKLFFGAFLFLILANSKPAKSQTKVKSFDQLIADTSGIEVLNHAIAIARNKFKILPADKSKAKEALSQTQISTRSPIGAVIYFTGGILIDNGWIRILGSGNKKLERTLPGWNKGKSFDQSVEQTKFLLIADDVIGGFFAINGGAFGNDLGKIYYLAPDRLKWEAQHINYSDFINFCFVGDLNQFYNGLRWDNWSKDLADITSDKGFYFYPFLWTKEGKDINKTKRSVVTIEEIYTFETDAIKQAGK